MAESEHLLPGPAGTLELRLRHAPGAPLALLCAPHPLYGGSLRNPVIHHAARALGGAGWSALRFNYRGVGRSQGHHDQGRGELDDLDCVARWALGELEPAALLLVGYSFGAWCALRQAATPREVAGLVLLGLPTSIYELGPLLGLARPLAVVQGELDELGPPHELERLLAAPPAARRLELVAGAPHSFAAHAQTAAKLVAELARWCLEPS